MEQQKLPNVTIALVLGIISYVGCCCTSGFGGILFSGIALFLINKDTKTYQENPQEYSNFGQLKTAKIVSIIGLVLSVIIVGLYIFFKSTGAYDEMMEEFMKGYNQGQGL
ncbi:CCC motif membrane protein [Cellulophaga omnivescoria]|uniref:CCC motif membrane protein n=1 Tax=Cellulophaga omnivescoria TaxID=1888890 RepID=UPI00098548D1|nr:CCC motif membrane protein [Cellulophaga omnivescoria]WBU89446.1 CCC motif membrane protein [Cellulophaga omnivescoria]